MSCGASPTRYCIPAIRGPKNIPRPIPIHRDIRLPIPIIVRRYRYVLWESSPTIAVNPPSDDPTINHAPCGTSRCPSSRPHRNPRHWYVLCQPSPACYCKTTIRRPNDNPRPIRYTAKSALPIPIIVARHGYVLAKFPSPTLPRHHPKIEEYTMHYLGTPLCPLHRPHHSFRAPEYPVAIPPSQSQSSRHPRSAE